MTKHFDVVTMDYNHKKKKKKKSDKSVLRRRRKVIGPIGPVLESDILPPPKVKLIKEKLVPKDAHIQKNPIYFILSFTKICILSLGLRDFWASDS